MANKTNSQAKKDMNVFKRRPSYLPLNNQDFGKSGLLCTIPFGLLAWGTVSLPFIAFVFCVVWSVTYHFDTTVATHCRVDNFLPSISAAIGNESPQLEIWQVLIILHAPTRFLVVAMYQQYFWAVLRTEILWLATLNCIISIVENLALLGLTIFPSATDYPVHEKCFMLFIATSEIYMMLCCHLLTYHRSMPASAIEARSLRLKKSLLTVNMLSFALAGYFFYRHNSYCEPFIYTFFALFEYIVVLTNMGFHMTAYYDLFERRLHVGMAKFWIS